MDAVLKTPVPPWLRRYCFDVGPAGGIGLTVRQSGHNELQPDIA